MRDVAAGNRNLRIRAGFFDTARYPSGEYVATVAARNEFGVPGRVPARPFMQHAADRMPRRIAQALRARINKRTLTLSDHDAEMVGLVMEDTIRDSIVNGPWAPNAPATVAAKGSDKPLIDTGFLRQSVTSRVEGR